MKQVYLEKFNKNLEQFIKHIKETILYTDVSDEYKFPLEGTEHIEYFLINCKDKGTDIATKNEIIFSKNINIIKNIDFYNVWNSDYIEDLDRNRVWEYLHILYVYAYQYNTDTDIKTLIKPDKKDKELDEDTKTVIDIIQTMKHKIHLDKNIDNINIDDDITSSNNTSFDNTSFDMPDLFSGSIGNLAKELLEDIDTTVLTSGDSSDLLSGLMSGNLDINKNSGIGSLISDITAKLEKKLKNGDLDQNALFKEATDMVHRLGIDPNMVNNQNTGTGINPDILNNIFNNTNMNQDIFNNTLNNIDTDDIINNVIQTKSKNAGVLHQSENKQKLQKRREILKKKLEEKKKQLRDTEKNIS